MPNTRIAAKVRNHGGGAERNESTLAFVLRIGRVRVPEIGYTIYLVLKRIMSEVL